jgi:hypothetical protein
MPVIIDRLWAHVHSLESKVEALMSQQSELNADVATIAAALGQVETDVTSLTSYIASLVANEQPLDMSQLDTLAQTAASTVSGLTALVPSQAPVASAPVTAPVTPPATS